ncbi:DUF4395 family protein [Frankia sp. CiP3]|uniref:DUF4395 family protein n=1 Tax=Frankia sp. CiP3 TaxID=2880971 RepID=UPI001EF4C31D|nr:DUF4395 family protein [Frankia sp. CiP3]
MGAVRTAVRRIAALGWGPLVELADERPPWSGLGQAVGALFGTVGAIGFLIVTHPAGYIATTFACVAALLNAVIGFCLGCQLYLAIRSVKGVHT